MLCGRGPQGNRSVGVALGEGPGRCSLPARLGEGQKPPFCIPSPCRRARLSCPLQAQPCSSRSSGRPCVKSTQELTPKRKLPGEVGTGG